MKLEPLTEERAIYVVKCPKCGGEVYFDNRGLAACGACGYRFSVSITLILSRIVKEGEDTE